MNRIAASLAAVTISLGAPLAAQEHSLDTTFTVRGTPRVSVNNLSGTIVVTGWNRPAVRLQAEYDNARVEADVSPSRVAVRTLSRRGDNEVTYTLTVPVGTSLELSGNSTDIDVRGVCGEASISITSGDLTLACAQGAVSVQSISGDIVISDIRSGSLDVSVSSGDVDIRNVRASVRVRSTSGEIDLSDVDAAEVTAETVSGEVAFAGRIHDGGRYRFEAHSGDVTVRATNAFNASVTVSTFSGDFEPDFPITITPGRQNAREWEFTVCSGSARMTLRSFSGTINLRRGAAARGGRPDRENEP